jgi:DNA invertase Pin-like site-specific DNA recombinase
MSDKIGERHLRRKAVLYVRQSTVQQLRHNEESRRLQYAMRDRLGALGWKDVEVIDDDLGRSAGGMVERAGFQRLVAEVSLGEIGAVAARELSRFARNSRDWQRLIEVCRYVDTILVDQDAVYDARQSNDRLLLGLKGSLNEYELDLLRLRSQEARKAKASRGEFIAKVAVGYRKNDDGQLEKTPDLRVQQAIALVIDKSLELGSARQCLQWLRERGLQVPVNRSHRGEVLWKAPHYSWVHHVLTNPIYAGAYAYGRTATRPVIRDGEARLKVSRRRREEWVLIHDHHDAYMDWERFERLQQMLAKNTQRLRTTKPGAAKKGGALLSGLLRCRRCGQKLMVCYSGQDYRVHRYSCTRRTHAFADPACISFAGREVDDRVADLVLEVVQPAAEEAALRAAADEQQARDGALDALRLQLEAARYAAERAARQFDAVDPENRLVADELERRWNQALESVREIELRVERAEAISQANGQVPAAETFQSLGADLARVWNDPATDVRLKKRIARTLVEEIVVDVDEGSSEISLVIHWKGGVHTELRVAKRRRGYSGTHTPSDVVEAVRLLSLIGDDENTAHWLGKAGLVTSKGNRWSRALVASLRHSRGIPAFSAEQCDDEGWLTLNHAATLVGVAEVTLKRAIQRGVVTAQRPLPRGPWILRRDELLRPDVRQRILKKPRPSQDDRVVHPSKQLALTIPPK